MSRGVRLRVVRPRRKSAYPASIIQPNSARIPQFTENFSIFVTTWNVAGNRCPMRSTLNKLLLGEGGVAAPRLYDIVAVGLQEMVPLNIKNVALSDSAASKSAHEWDRAIESVLNSTRETYQLVGSKHVVGIHLCVFVRTSLHKHVTNVSSDISKVGIGGVMGNKGSSAIRFRFFGSSLCFVCSHLAAHRHAVAARNNHFKSSLRQLFATPSRGVREEVSRVIESDHVIWLGDLNYRIATGLTPLEVLDHIDKNELDLLRERDQLTIERKAGRAFAGFEEGELWFRPTYKYTTNALGQMRYDVDGDDKGKEGGRAPAWCDRVLWRCRQPRSCVLEEYGRTELRLSDHMPVKAKFRIAIPVTKPLRRKRSKIAIRVGCKNLNACSPFVRLSTRGKTEKVWIVVGETERARGDDNPTFKTTLEMDFQCGVDQQLRLEVLDVDYSGGYRLVGVCRTSVSAMFTTVGNSNSFRLVDEMGEQIVVDGGSDKLKGRLTYSTLSLHIGHMSATEDMIKLQLAAHHLDSLLLSCNPVYVISTPEKTSSHKIKWVPVFVSETVESNMNPKWRSCLVNAHKIGMRSDSSKVKIGVYDCDTSTHPMKNLIGSCITTFGELKCRQTKHATTSMGRYLPLIRPPTTKKFRDQSYTSSGALEVVCLKRIKNRTLLDLAMGGLQINLTIGIDFTAQAMGRSSSYTPTARARASASGMQGRISALRSLGCLLQGYDYNKVLHAFGFGARDPGHASPCFPLDRGDQFRVHRIRGLLRAYEYSLARSDLAPAQGPSDLVPMLQKLRRNVTSAPHTRQKYHVLMMLIDGGIANLEHTVNELVLLAKLPVSIVIVGIGATDFSSVEQVCRRSRPSAGVCARECVEFVRFDASEGSPSDLAASLAPKLSEQVEVYLQTYRAKADAVDDSDALSSISPMLRPVLTSFNKL